jgi:hypothetical protein
MQTSQNHGPNFEFVSQLAKILSNIKHTSYIFTQSTKEKTHFKTRTMLFTKIRDILSNKVRMEWNKLWEPARTSPLTASMIV